MFLQYLDRLAGSDYQEQVYTLLAQCEKEFVPPLSQRSSTTQGDLLADTQAEDGLRYYFQTLSNQSIILVLDDGKLLGFMSFIPNHICKEIDDPVETAYVTTIIVDPCHRGKGLTRQMYEKLFRLFQTAAISTRTWSTNHAHITILKRLGFYALSRICDGRGAGIDTIYFRKDGPHYG